MIRLIMAVVVTAVMSACAVGAGAPSSTDDITAAALRSAQAAAGDDLKYLYDVQCRPWRPALKVGTPSPMKITDNLYYVGAGTVGAWALDTSDGIVVLDAMNNAEEAKTLIAGGLSALGLDPARIRYVIVHHGHYDHMGGAAFLQRTYGAKVWMTAGDYEMAGQDEINRKNGLEMPALDHAIADGEVLRLGSTTLTFHYTPGHTPGVISTILATSYREQPLALAIWGGTAFPRDPHALDDYVRSVRSFAAKAQAAKVLGVLSNHGEVDDVMARMQALRNNPDVNPFILGEDTTQRFFAVLEGCALASKSWSGVR